MAVLVQDKGVEYVALNAKAVEKLLEVDLHSWTTGKGYAWEAVRAKVDECQVVAVDG